MFLKGHISLEVNVNADENCLTIALPNRSLYEKLPSEQLVFLSKERLTELLSMPVVYRNAILFKGIEKFVQYAIPIRASS
jgi:hypothetical protein